MIKNDAIYIVDAKYLNLKIQFYHPLNQRVHINVMIVIFFPHSTDWQITKHLVLLPIPSIKQLCVNIWHAHLNAIYCGPEGKHTKLYNKCVIRAISKRRERQGINIAMHCDLMQCVSNGF